VTTASLEICWDLGLDGIVGCTGTADSQGIDGTNEQPLGRWWLPEISTRCVATGRVSAEAEADTEAKMAIGKIEHRD
jgi:hypothetical protein